MRGWSLSGKTIQERRFEQMSESWIQLISAAVLGWVAWELRQLRRDINSRVHYHDCDRRMNDFHHRLEHIERSIE